MESEEPKEKISETIKEDDRFCKIHTFEECVLKCNEKKKELYILSYNYPDKYGIFLSRLSIFDDEKRGTVKQDKEKVNKILEILMKNDEPKEKTEKLKELNVSEIEKKAIGSMLGMAIGDAMGARFEFDEVTYGKIELKNMGEGRGGNFFLEPGQWTDDTSMGLCIADSLIMNNGELVQHDIMHRFIAWWRGGYNNAFRYDKNLRHSVGLGGNISLSFDYYLYYYNQTNELAKAETKAGDKNTSGNGSIMRNAAIPICFYKDTDKACEMARKQSLITHQGDEAKECCSLLTHIIVKIINGEEKNDIFENLGKTFHSDIESVNCLANHQREGDDKDRDWNWTVDQYHYSPTRTRKQGGYVGSYAMDNMAMSLNTIYKTSSFEEAMIRAANIRGDSDSVASVVGQIAGALYPIEAIPGDWIKAIYKWDHGEIALRGYMLARILNEDNNNNQETINNETEKRHSYIVQKNNN